jgi:hypothetical protein
MVSFARVTIPSLRVKRFVISEKNKVFSHQPVTRLMLFEVSFRAQFALDCWLMRKVYRIKSKACGVSC